VPKLCPRKAEEGIPDRPEIGVETVLDPDEEAVMGKRKLDKGDYNWARDKQLRNTDDGCPSCASLRAEVKRLSERLAEFMELTSQEVITRRELKAAKFPIDGYVKEKVVGQIVKELIPFVSEEPSPCRDLITYRLRVWLRNSRAMKEWR
jgi:hypothetical protein